MASMVVSPSEFVPDEHVIYTKAKANASGGKSVGILNTMTRKPLHLNTPLMMTLQLFFLNSPLYTLLLLVGMCYNQLLIF